jgi:hypothetical protein
MTKFQITRDVGMGKFFEQQPESISPLPWNAWSSEKYVKSKCHTELYSVAGFFFSAIRMLCIFHVHFRCT